MKFFVRRFLLIGILLISFAAPAFSKPWYVCLGSFKNPDNAQKFMIELFSEGLQICIAEHQLKDGILYRVLINQPCETWDEVVAVQKKLKAQKKIMDKISGNLWACEASPVITIRKPAESELKIEAESEIQKNTVQKPESIPEEEEEEVTVVDDTPAESKEMPVEMTAEAENSEATPEVTAETPAEETPEKIILEKNTDNIPVNDEKPYSVLIRNYKEEQVAENDKKRLKEKDIDSYILKTYDEDTLLNFGLHSGAFESEEETEALQEKLEDLGINDTKISNYNDISENIKNYENLIQNEQIVYENVSLNYPTMLSERVIKCIEAAPVNTQFQVDYVLLQDYVIALENDDYSYNGYDNLKDYVNTIQYAEFLNYYKDKTDALICYKLQDSLYNKSFAVFMALAPEDTFNDFASIGENKTEVLAAKGFTNCGISSDDLEKYILTGINDTGSSLLLIDSSDYTEKEFEEVLKALVNNDTILSYPQIRKTFLISPDSTDEYERKFTLFRFERTMEDYAADRDYAKWAMGIVGHFESTVEYYENDTHALIGIFEMDYDHNAKTIHQIFKEAQEARESSSSYKSKYEKADSWYSANFLSNELSFNYKSYIFAIDSAYFREDELCNIADALKIWE